MCETIDNLNSLPDYVVNSENINQFKNLLDNFWKKDRYIYTNKLNQVCTTHKEQVNTDN